MTSNHGVPPSEEVLRSFGLSGHVRPIAGGQGECFVVVVVGQDTTTTTANEMVVLKPTSSVEESEFVADLQCRLLQLGGEDNHNNNSPPQYRIAEPIRRVDSDLGSSTITSTTTTTKTTTTDTSTTNDVEKNTSDSRRCIYVVTDHRTDYSSSFSSPIHWTATKFVTGKGDPTVRVTCLLKASRALHRDLKKIYPAYSASSSTNPIKTPPIRCIAERKDRWAYADRYAWSEMTEKEIPNVNFDLLESTIGPYIKRLERLRDLLSPGKEQQEERKGEEDENQLIHGDLSGNLLFDDDDDDDDDDNEGENDNNRKKLPPAIIDFSPYWRPAEYSEAIVAADLLLWKKGDISLLKENGLLLSSSSSSFSDDDDDDDDEEEEEEREERKEKGEEEDVEIRRDGKRRDATTTTTTTKRMRYLINAMIFRLFTFVVDSDVGFIERNLNLMDCEGAVVALEKEVYTHKSIST